MNIETLRRRFGQLDGLFAGLFFLLLAWTIGHAIWHEVQPETIPVPPLYFKEGTWYTDGSKGTIERAVDCARTGEVVSFTIGKLFWSNGGYMLVYEGGSGAKPTTVSVNGVELPEKKP